MMPNCFSVSIKHSSI